MPWKETCVMEERMQFVLAAKKEGSVMSQLCAEAGISRQTGYTLLRRYESEGVEGLKERSRAPHQHGRSREAELVDDVLALRAHYGWGAKKLRHKLGELHAGIELPAASTIGDWLAKRGLTHRRRHRAKCPAYSQPFTAASEPNAVWATDFKGWFRTGDGARCDPLTLSDAMSRYLLRCQTVVRPDYAHVRPVFETAFSEYGLPWAIRSDNGPPFASTAAGGLSALSLWWIKLDIRPERIEPAKPQQNGRHERMHLTLKKEATKPAAKNFLQQQARFDQFIDTFNQQRPHQALNMRYPAEVYQPSPRPYKGLPELEYPFHDRTVTITRCGRICFGRQKINLSQAFAGQRVGVKQVTDRVWLVSFMQYDLGYFDDKTCRIESAENPFAAKLSPMSPV